MSNDNREASPPITGLIRQITRLGVAAIAAFLVQQGLLDEESATAVADAVFIGVTGTLLPILAAAGKYLRDQGNPIGEIL